MIPHLSLRHAVVYAEGMTSGDVIDVEMRCGLSLDQSGLADLIALVKQRGGAVEVTKPPRLKPGGVPYGSRVVEGRLVNDAVEQAVIKMAQALHGSGMSLQRVAEALTAEGYRTRGGGPWKRQYIARLVKGGE